MKKTSFLFIILGILLLSAGSYMLVTNSFSDSSNGDSNDNEVGDKGPSDGTGDDTPGGSGSSDGTGDDNPGGSSGGTGEGDGTSGSSSVVYNIIVGQNKENGAKVLDSKASTYVSSETGIDFNAGPSNTNGKGVYIRTGTESDKYPIYYYRGEVANNNIIFAGYCWKMVITTETGGTKLIYNGVPKNKKCNNMGTSSQIGTSAFNEEFNSNAYVGYMYGTPGSSIYDDEHANENDSTIKQVIDKWYERNLTEYASYLEDAIWCNDRSFGDVSWSNGDGTGTEVTYYGAQTRNYSETASGPSLECINQNDRFTVDKKVTGRTDGNGALTYPIALLTADEVTFAGQGWNSYNEESYLHTSEFWWSMSPYRFANERTTMFRVNSATYSGYGNDKIGVRPAVSLKYGIKVAAGGDGSESNPFVVE